MTNSRLKIDDDYYAGITAMIQTGGLPQEQQAPPQVPQVTMAMPQGGMSLDQVLGASSEIAGLPPAMMQAMGGR